MGRLGFPRPLDCKLVLWLANSAYKERGLESIMGKSKWRELKSRYNVAKIEVPEPQEEDVAPLETRRKRKRGEKEVGGTSTPRDAEEVTSKAADADAVDPTGSSPPEGAPQAASEQVAQATEVALSSEVPGAGAAVVEQEAPASASVDARGKGSRSEVPTPTPATSAPPSSSSKGPPRSQYLAHCFGKDRSQVQLDHVSASEDIDSLWSAEVTSEKFFSKESLSTADQAMIETARPVEGLDSAEEDLAKLKGRVQPLREENKALKEENRALAGALGDAKLQNEAELQATRRELERVQKSLEIALRSNETHAAQVSELQELANSSRGRLRALEDEVTSLKVDLVVAAEKRLCDKVLLGGKEEEVAALRVDLSKMVAEKEELKKKLEGTERAVLFEHKRGFLKASRQARLLAPGVDLSAMHVEKEVRFGKLVKEDDLQDSSSENASA
ncbi:uncharacterized protein LOC109811659 [Cajanus cajan]|uniref:uncharacterized protein LOC109811659 n=1 Tax=Cajanus cajan TaxID=3821 RepID=UPI00098DA98D|nr:uncharacterized protein LOC109811659 [Cajanus cajan]